MGVLEQILKILTTLRLCVTILSAELLYQRLLAADSYSFKKMKDLFTSFRDHTVNLCYSEINILVAVCRICVQNVISINIG
jgi:hypothetical protein